MAQNPWELPDGFDESVKEAVKAIFKAFANAKKMIPKSAIDALKSGNIDQFMSMIDWTGIDNQFNPLKDMLAESAKNAGIEVFRKGNVGTRLIFDIIDERAVNYAQWQSAKLVVEITEAIRQNIRDVVARSTAGDMTWNEVSESIYRFIPLTSRDAKAVQTYHDRQYNRFLKKGVNAETAKKRARALADKYADKLTVTRATTIARTEIANAAMEGSYLGWETGVEEGFIDGQARKEWVAEPDACEICHEMDGKTVQWDDAFEFGGMMPPAHPNCRCSTALMPAMFVDSPWTRQATQKSLANVFEIELAKHLEGRHDQSSHGHHGVAYTLPSKREAPNLSIYSEVSSTKPYVGLSPKAQAIAAQIGATYGEVKSAKSQSMRSGYADITYADWKSSDGKTHKLALHRELTIDEQGNKVTPKLPELHVEIDSGIGSESYLNTSASWAGKLEDSNFYYAITDIFSDVKGSATAMLEFARRESDYPIFHNSDLTSQGRKFARTTKSVTKAEESYKPTSGMVAAAERALRWKKEGKATGAGTPVGWGRATDIAAGRSMSFDVVQRMYSFFSRHEVDKKGKDFDNLSNPSNGRIMWDAWGGNAGFGWSRNIVERHKRMEKHLQGQHDQASHGRKGHIKSGYNNWYKHLPDLRLAGQELTKQGNASQMVIVESAGFNGKPKMVELSELDPDKIMYRGVMNEEYKTDFLESEVQFGGLGVLGNGTYFTNNSDTAKNYTQKYEWDDKRMIIAQWIPDANVLKFESRDEGVNWLLNEQRTFKEGLGDHFQSDTSDFAGIGGQLSSYFVDGMNFTNMAIMKGYDGLEMNVKIGNKEETYTVVLNRGKLMVAK